MPLGSIPVREERKQAGQREKLGFNASTNPMGSYGAIMALQRCAKLRDNLCMSPRLPPPAAIHKSLGAGCPWTEGVTVGEAAEGNSQGGAQCRAISLQHPQKLGQEYFKQEATYWVLESWVLVLTIY